MTANKLEGKARELLAQEYEHAGYENTARRIREMKVLTEEDDAALRAIRCALDTARQSEGMVRSEVRKNHDGTLDEVCGYGPFHLEQMDSGHWYIGLGDVQVWLRSSRAIKANHERHVTAAPADAGEVDRG